MSELPKDLWNTPALEPPPGVTPHFVTFSPDLKFYLGMSLCTIIPGLLVILRFYNKIRIVRKTDLADYSILVSFLLLLAIVGIARMTSRFGVGVHQWNIRLVDYMRQAYWLYIGELLYGPTIFLIKAAIVLQYIQLFAPLRCLDPFVYIGGWVTILLMFLSYTTMFFVLLFMCRPREKLWNPYHKDGECLDAYPLVYSIPAINVIYDLAVMLLPVPSIWKLHIPLKKKCGIILLFATGLVATVATWMRIFYTVEFKGSRTKINTSYMMAFAGLSSVVEIALGITIACCLSLTKFLSVKLKELSNFSRSVSKRFTEGWNSLNIKQTKSNTSGGSMDITPPRSIDAVCGPSEPSLTSGGGSFTLKDIPTDSEEV
ncbi:uncharacterized protein EI97DRAFT_498677 [Westerdykella ornata]|uniref:Rhodopsin domain-containing protein n=1 Tax=Westerdykella ornata TaxID=318751 RepID=A0A6A6JWD3_WESOR|nr:uncharacterized protein EI97DRAFT_498677 [Westerdykella ornata]KAF2280535.1 hypothetical protein EI97DRAFT_498677 [Westerdykella ornata]